MIVHCNIHVYEFNTHGAMLELGGDFVKWKEAHVPKEANIVNLIYIS